MEDELKAYKMFILRINRELQEARKILASSDQEEPFVEGKIEGIELTIDLIEKYLLS